MLWAAACPVRADEEASQLQTLVEKTAPAVASLRVVLKTEYKGGGASRDQESRLTMQGVVVTPDGLLMLSNTPFSTKRMMEMMGAEGMIEDLGMKITPVAFKVSFPGDEKEYDAFLAATDTNLDLAFVKVEGLEGKTLAVVDFGSAVNPTIGQRVVAVSRLSKGYDYAPYFQSGRVVGEITKPRRAWILEGGISEFGLPVFTTSGEVIGVLTTVPSGVKDEGLGDSMSMGFSFLMRMLGGGGGGVAGGVFVVPGATVKSVIERAAAKAVEVAAERAKKKAQKEAEKAKEPKKETTKPKEGKPKKP